MVRRRDVWLPLDTGHTGHRLKIIKFQVAVNRKQTQTYIFACWVERHKRPGVVFAAIAASVWES